MERCGNPSQEHDRNISFAGLKLRQMPFRNVRLARHHFARQPAPVAQFPHAFPERLKKTVVRRVG